MQHSLAYTHKLYESFRFSYGAWTWLAKFLEPIEFLVLQQLCRYTYKISISRVQYYWYLYTPTICALTIPISKTLQKTIFVIDDSCKEK